MRKLFSKLSSQSRVEIDCMLTEQEMRSLKINNIIEFEIIIIRDNHNI
jgi:hypothetical protein